MFPSPTDAPGAGGSWLDRGSAEDLARTLRAVADPTRLQVLSVILSSEDGRATVSHLTDALGLTQPTVTHHVRILVEDGMLRREREGKFIWLSIEPARRAAVADVLR